MGSDEYKEGGLIWLSPILISFLAVSCQWEVGKAWTRHTHISIQNHTWALSNNTCHMHSSNNLIFVRLVENTMKSPWTGAPQTRLLLVHLDNCIANVISAALPYFSQDKQTLDDKSRFFILEPFSMERKVWELQIPEEFSQLCSECQVELVVFLSDMLFYRTWSRTAFIIYQLFWSY